MRVICQIAESIFAGGRTRQGGVFYGQKGMRARPRHFRARLLWSLRGGRLPVSPSRSRRAWSDRTPVSVHPGNDPHAGELSARAVPIRRRLPFRIRSVLFILAHEGLVRARFAREILDGGQAT